MMWRDEKCPTSPIQRTEAFSILPILDDSNSRTVFTLKQWDGGERINDLWFEWIHIDISTSECKRGEVVGTSQGEFRNQWQSSYMKQPAMTTRTRRTEEEEDQQDIWQIAMDEGKIDIPDIDGELEPVEAAIEAKGSMDGQVEIETLNGPIITAVEGAWEGLGAGAFEGAVEGDMEMVGTGTLIGKDDFTGTVSEPPRKVMLDKAIATLEPQIGNAAWNMKPRYSQVEDIASTGDGQTVSNCRRTQRANTGTMVWFFLYKAPDYVNPDLIGGIWDGYIDVGRVDGDRWLIGADRCVAGQKARIRVRDVHLRRREHVWLLAIVNRRMRTEIATTEQDFVHCAIGVAQRCNNY
jgi:hypothetical protein